MSSEAGVSADETALRAERAATGPVDRPDSSAIAAADRDEPPGLPPAEKPLPDENAIDERSLVGLYARENAEVYLRTYDRVVASRYGVLTWSWPALLVPVAWLAYRRLWVPVAWFVFLPFVLFYLTEVQSGLVAVQVAFATQAKQLYVWQAQKRIARILAVERDPQSIRRMVVQAGGVSAAGFLLGGLFTVGTTLVALGIVFQGAAE